VTLIQQNRYDQLLRRVGDLKGPGSKVNDVLSELFPMFDVENLPAELLLLAGIRTCMGGGTVAGVAAQSGKAQLFNPAGSGYLVTLTDIYVSNAAASTIRWGRSNATFGAAIGTETFTDTRTAVTSSPVADVRQLSEAAGATATNQTRLGANINLHISNNNAIVTLAPGFGFEIGQGVTNASFFFGFNWRERVAEPSELSF